MHGFAQLVFIRYRCAALEQPGMICGGHVSSYRSALMMCAALAVGTAPAAAQFSLAQQTVGQSMIDKAWNELYSDPRDSLRLFEGQLPQWAGFSKQSGGYIDADRGSLIAAVLAGDDSAARASWRRIKQETGGVVAELEPPGDVHAWNGDWTSAFRSYRDAGNFGTAACTVQTNQGLDKALSGHLQQAIEIWSADPNCPGPYELTDVHLALTGDAFAAQNKWSAARSTWIQAARQGRVVPQMAMLYSGNVMALSMLYHLRGRLVAIPARLQNSARR